MYRGHVFSAERVSNLAPREVVECVHAQLGRTSSGHLFFTWMRSNDHEKARDTPTRRDRTTNRERTSSTVQVWSHSCESCPGHVAFIFTANQTLHWLLKVRDLTWWRDNRRRWRGNRHFHRRPRTQRRWEQHFDDYWNKFGLEWKTVAKGRPRFDAGLKEFTNIHEAQSRKIKDEDVATWI